MEILAKSESLKLREDLIHRDNPVVVGPPTPGSQNQPYAPLQ